MPALNEESYFQTLTEWSAQLRARAISSSDLTKAYLERLEKIGPRFNAVALMLRKDALDEARDADRLIKRGRFKGVLQGIPYGAKDLLSVAGRRTEWGAPQFAGQVFKTSATVVNKLKKAGAVLAAKLSMIELAGGGGYRYASASVSGPCRNPWNPDRWAGGSSSGSAAAVAAGLVPYAIGSETSGSIITPCAFCGVTGLRPTYGLVSRAGCMALSWTLDKIGPIGRSAEDCGRILDAIAGGDLDDPGSARKSFHYFPQFAPAFKDLRVGYSKTDIEEFADAGLRPALNEAFDRIRGLGVQLVEVSLPDHPYSAAVSTIIAAEASSIFEDLIEDGSIRQLKDERQVEGLAAAASITAATYLRACRIRSLVRADFAKLFRTVDVIFTPSRYSTAPPIDLPLDRPPATQGSRQAGGLRSMIAAGNLAGLPALTLPCGFADGLPVAFSLVSRPFTENVILSIGVEYQRLTDWHRRRPAM
ncbi:MAG: amidase [Bryobacteraceae bacterium]|nr:amidase [Bryobacteraceae bacterium]